MIQEQCKIWFSLNYGSIDNVLSQLLTVSRLGSLHLHVLCMSTFQLHKAAKLPRSDKLTKVRKQCIIILTVLVISMLWYLYFFPQIDQMRRHRWSAISFNRSWLEDIYEETICELPGERITPLVSNPGRIMLTSARLYFQPYNNVEVVSC